MRWKIILGLVIALGVHGAAVVADSAGDWFDRGRLARQREDYRAARDAFREAYRLQSSSITAVMLAESAARVKGELPAAMRDLRVWLHRKRDEARKAGDVEASWDVLEKLMAAYCDAVAAYQDTYVLAVAWRREVAARETIVDIYEIAGEQWHDERVRLTEATKELSDRNAELEELNHELAAPPSE